MRFLLLTALCALRLAAAVDVRFSTLVAQRAVVNFGMTAEYKDSKQTEFVPYTSCPPPGDENSDDSVCPDLTWDEDSVLRISFTRPAEGVVSEAAVTKVGDQELEDPAQPVKFKIQACFENPYKKNRKWRKAKDVIQDDKRCSRKIVGKQDLPAPGETVSFDYEIKSDMPGAHFFLTLFVFCKEEGSDDDHYCALDTTGELEDLAKRSDLQKRKQANDNVNELYEQTTSSRLSFRTSVIDSRPTELIVCVIVLSCLSVSLLVLYFIYERALKKSA